MGKRVVGDKSKKKKESSGDEREVRGRMSDAFAYLESSRKRGHIIALGWMSRCRRILELDVSSHWTLGAGCLVGYWSCMSRRIGYWSCMSRHHRILGAGCLVTLDTARAQQVSSHFIGTCTPLQG